MHFQFSVIRLLLLGPLFGGLAGCSLLPKPKYQPPSPRPIVKAPAPGEAARIGASGIGASGSEFNSRLT